jgi:hypothetical protein
MTKIRAVLALLALAAVAALTVGLSSPAHAIDNPCPNGEHAPPCADYLLWSPPFDDGCPHCPEYAIAFVEDRYLSQADRWRYLNDLRDGLLLLNQSRVAQKPELRDEAWRKFTDAVSTLGGACVKPTDVGFYDRQTGRIEAAPFAWLKGAGSLFADGLDGDWCGTPIPGRPPWPWPIPDPRPFDKGLDQLLAGGQAG